MTMEHWVSTLKFLDWDNGTCALYWKLVIPAGLNSRSQTQVIGTKGPVQVQISEFLYIPNSTIDLQTSTEQGMKFQLTKREREPKIGSIRTNRRVDGHNGLTVKKMTSEEHKHIFHVSGYYLAKIKLKNKSICHGAPYGRSIWRHMRPDPIWVSRIIIFCNFTFVI
jgi:hypothetical protein